MYAIVAVDEKWGIGRDNALLFHLSADLKRFKELTSGHTVLMGRKTLESLPGGRGLPNRRNIVLTGQRGFTAERAEIVHSPAEALLTADEDAWVIGGESVYRMFSGEHWVKFSLADIFGTTGAGSCRCAIGSI